MESTLELKRIILLELIKLVERELSLSKSALRTTKDLAQSEDFKSESKWDTRAIEASYLAGAQEKRVKELELEISQLKQLLSNITLKDSISAGSIVETKNKVYFVTLATGGHKIVINNQTFDIISIKAPIFQKLMEEEIEIIGLT